MIIPAESIRKRLRAFEIQVLFVEDLGWDYKRQILSIVVDGNEVGLELFAHKRGLGALRCPPVDGTIPDHNTRMKIDREVTKAIREHIIVYVDAEGSEQVWQWTRRDPGLPVRSRETRFSVAQHGDLLIQRLTELAFHLEEEESLTITDATGRVRAAFDVEGVTKRFYDRFKTEHSSFLKLISGMEDSSDREWYGSVMLNRLMFAYFIQRKGFLDGDANYLRNRLERCQRDHGKDRFYSFYRYFLLRLFHEGLGSRERNAELNSLLGKIPYLNGGLFDIHELEKPERYGKRIQIPDKAFSSVFDYFDEYQWSLDERPLRADNEINPDVLGYIFEKYVNQKQMGAYYTKEDITEYISKNTVVPFLFDAARAKCKVAFENSEGPTVWDLLQADPGRYIYPGVRHGTDQPLPDKIAAGVNPPMLHQPVGDRQVQSLKLRKGWNKPAPDEYALPTETWREVVARRTRYEEVLGKLAAGDVRDINDLITLNLDIRQFAQDVIENCEGPELLRAFWHAIEKVTILDPTCGSGAFLFAALNILEPLYEACLDRMEAFVEDLDRSAEKHRPEKFSDFRKVLARVAAHPSRRYFTFKSIILNNLFGVDIMEEAVEICKLRLFLKLAAQVEPDTTHGNLGIEPLPDIDFNIKAGNTLVGFASYDDAKRAITSRFDFDNAMEKIAVKAADLQQAFDAFRERQVEGDGSVPMQHKLELRKRLTGLQGELNRYMAGEYGVEPAKNDVYAKWLKSHQPFHWFVEFYGIMNSGGFDVIIGNPPYVEYSKVKQEYTIHGYSTETCGNLYAYVIERSFDTLCDAGRMGMIVQLPIVCTDRMKPIQKECLSQSQSIWFANFDDRPARLFDGLEHIRASILTTKKGQSKTSAVYSTKYNRWYSELRPMLFGLITFEEISGYLMAGAIPKIGRSTAKSVRNRIASFAALGTQISPNARHHVYFHNAPQYWIRAMDFVPYFWNERDGEKMSSHVKKLSVANKLEASIAGATLNSSLFYWWFIMLSNCRDLVAREIESFPVGLERMSESTKSKLAELSGELMTDLKKYKQRKEAEYGATGKVMYDEFYPKFSKPILDQIDCVLARHYGFTQEELDFIINYDINYRMGPSAEQEGRNAEGEDE